jgi:hypothetical protein
VRFGFTAPEFTRQVDVLLRSMERALVEASFRPVGRAGRRNARNYTRAEPIPGLSAEVEFARRFLPSFSLEEVKRARPAMDS